MGKTRHSKDRLYLTATEWKELGGYKEKRNAPFKALPFDRCSLTFQPFEDAVMTPQGHVFDILAIIPWIKEHGTNPVNGKPLRAKDLIHLKFHKNADNEYTDPVTFKPFTNHSHIVAIRKTGNVFAYDTIKELNMKGKNWNDLLTGEPFHRDDLVTLQNPADPNLRLIDSFEHVKKPPSGSSASSAGHGSIANKINATGTTAKILDKMREQGVTSDAPSNSNPMSRISTFKDNVPAAASQHDLVAKKHTYSDGRMAASFTSTGLDVVYRQTAAAFTEEDVRQARYAWLKREQKKAYARIKTNMGDINVELHCDLTGRTCENFIGLASKGFYNGLIFHRSIRNFMVQGGDPKGDGTGGESLWGAPFEDEFAPQLSHSGRGILSMANRGPGTNTSQFFITYKSCTHLDRKHSVFGRVVGGMDTLDRIENIPTDARDKPKKDVRIEKIVVFVNPYDEIPDDVGFERSKDAVDREEAERARRERERNEDPRGWFSRRVEPGQSSSTATVGKYLKNLPSHDDDADDEQGGSSMPPPAKKPKKASSQGFSDFSAW